MNDIALSSLRATADFDASKYKTGADQKVASDRAMVASAQAVGSAMSQTDTKISSAGDSLARLSRQYIDGYKNQERFEQGLRQIAKQLDSGKTDIDGATRLLVGMNQKLGLTADVSELAAKGQVQLAAAVGKANAQIEGQAASMAQAAATAAAQAERLETIRQKYDQTYASGQRMSSELAELAELERSGTQITGGYASALDNLVLKYDQTVAAAAAAANAHKQFIAAARIDQAAENGRQIAAANQSSFNSVLGVSAPSSGARASASVFEADFSQMEEVARQKAQQAGQRFGADLESSLVAGTAKSARDAAAVFSADFAQVEEVASLKAQQAGQAFGNDLDSSLVAGIAKSARDAASVFSAEMDRIDGIAKLKAEQIGSTFQSDLNASFGIGSGANSARASASVFEEAGRDADQMAARVAALRAELNPLAAAQDRLNAELAEYSTLAAKGVISTEELSAAQALARARAANQNNQGGMARFGAMNATSQFQDIAVTAAMGQSPMTIALQQGTQLGMAMQMQMGDQGAIGVVKGLGTAFMGLLSPINLVAIGLTGAAALAIQYFSSGAEKSKALDASLQKNRESIKALTDAYHMAGIGADELQRKSMGAAEAAERLSEKQLEAQIRLEQKRFTANTKPTDLMTFGMLGDNSADVAPEFAAFTDPIRQLRKEIDAQAKGDGKANFDAFFQQIDQIANTGPGAFHGFVDELVRGAGVKVETYSEIRDRLYEMGGAAAQAARQLELVLEVQRKIDQENTRPGLQDRRSLGRYVSTRDVQEGREQEQFAADQQMARARTNAEKIAAIERQERAKFPSQADEGGGRDARVEQARQQELTRQQMELKDAQDQRRRSLDQTLASAKLDVDLVGKTTAAVEGLRLAAQIEAQVREEAAIKGVKADEAEIARIKEKAAEYGKLRALQEARDTIHGQEIDLETQKAEVATVGENTLARNRAAAALKTEQDIRKLGIPLYGQEANAMRANTAALSDQATALAKASMQANLLFERSQILRNSTDQAIASAQQSAGLPVDLNSAEANMMRYNMALQETKDTFKGFATDMVSSLEQGKSLWESFGDAAKNALGKIADKLIDRGLDDIFGSLFGGQQSGGGGILGSLFGGTNSPGQNGQQQSPSGGSFLSKLFGGAGGQSVSSMQVQAAVVNVNGGVGGVGGGLSDILSKLGSPSFKADTTLSDILGYGGAGSTGPNTAATAAKLLSGLGSPLGAANDNLGGLTGSIGQYASAIKAIESAGSGGYSALGPMLKSGDQALGAYQVMKSNLPSWSTEAFGKPMSASQFMANPGAQDAVFQQQFGKLLDKYGNSNDAASAWFTGGPLSKGAGKSDVLGTTGSQYVDKFNTALSKLGGVTDHATGSINNLGSGASSALSSIGGAANDATKGLGQFGSALNQFPSAPSSNGGGIGGWLSSLFGGGGGLLGPGVTQSSMNAISPLATADINSGSWGLFDSGGFTGSGGRKQPAGIVHRGEIVWSQEDIARAGGVHVVEGMRRGYAGYADGGYVRPRMRGHNDSMGASADTSRGHSGSAANDLPPQNINQTNNFIFRENPATPASQNQIAAKSARALERLQRTA